MKPTLKRALAFGLALAALLGVMHLWGVGLPLLLTALGLFGLLCGLAPRSGVQALDAVIQWIRAGLWHRESGRHHSHGGASLDIEEHEGHMWISALSLQRAINRPEPESVTAARHAGQWRRNADGELMLKVQAVVNHLNTMPGRDDPPVQRFRRYLERDVLYPASRRRQGTGAGDNPLPWRQ